MDKTPKFAEQSKYEKYCVVASILFVAVLMSVGLCSFLLPQASYSEYEKRELTPMPDFSAQALFSGQFLRDFETHYADTFPWRDQFIQLGASIDEAKGIRGSDDVKIYDGTGDQQPPPPAEPAPSQEPPVPSPEPGQEPEAPGQSSQPESAPEAPPEVPDGYVTEGTFISGDRGCYLFGGNRPVARQYAAILTAFGDRLREVQPDTRVFNMVIPTSGEYYIPQRYQYMTASQKENIDYLYSSLGPSVQGVDADYWLRTHAQEYLYFRTDHHWTALGAYYAYVAYCHQAGVEPVSVSLLEKRTIQPFVGTIYNHTRDARLQQNPDWVDYYMVDPGARAYLTTKAQPGQEQEVPVYAEYASGGNAYSVFIWADNPLFRIQTGAGTGKSCLLMKESYGNAFAPWLMANYDTVYVIDYRHYEQSVYDFVVEHGVDDVLFLNNSFAANTLYHAQRIDYLCNQL